MIRRDPDDRRRPSTREESRERTALLTGWRRPSGLARLVAQIDAQRLAALLGFRPYNPAALKAELLSGAIVNVYAFGPHERRARGFIDHLRRDGLSIGALGRGRFKLLPKGARRSRSARRAAMRERLLSGEVVRYESAEKTLLYNLSRELRRAGYDIRCLGRGTKSYRLLPSCPSLASSHATSNDSPRTRGNSSA